MRKLFLFPFFGVLAGLFPIIALWNINKNQIYPRDALQSVLLSLAFVIVVWGIIWLITRSALRTSIAASLIFLLFFSFGHVYNLIEGKEFFGLSVGFVKLLFLYLLLLLVSLFIMIKVKSVPNFTVLLLNGILTLLLLVNLFQILNYNEIQKRSKLPPAETTSTVQNTLSPEQGLPDVYYIILDAYSRQDVMQSVVGYDNSEFINGLRERGFYVADCANANYDGTFKSVTSSLNYAYLNEDGKPIADDGQALPFDLINNSIRVELKKFGYQFVTTRGFSSENDIPNSDIYLNFVKDQGIKDTIAQAQFTRLYLETTLLRVAFEYYYMNPERFDVIPQWLFLEDSDDKTMGYPSYWYLQTRYVLDSLEKFPEKEGNYLIYAHINAPHGPYVFDRNGNFRYVYNPVDNIPYYTDAVIYIDRRILEVIDAIIEKSETPPIIILQGDHGAHVIATGIDKLKILSAYYFPGETALDLYETITPVNTFRLILRDYFNQDIGLLPDLLYAKQNDKYGWIPSECEAP